MEIAYIFYERPSFSTNAFHFESIQSLCVRNINIMYLIEPVNSADREKEWCV